MAGLRPARSDPKPSDIMSFDRRIYTGRIPYAHHHPEIATMRTCPKCLSHHASLDNLFTPVWRCRNCGEQLLLNDRTEIVFAVWSLLLAAFMIEEASTHRFSGWFGDTGVYVLVAFSIFGAVLIGRTIPLVVLTNQMRRERTKYMKWAGWAPIAYGVLILIVGMMSWSWGYLIAATLLILVGVMARRGSKALAIEPDSPEADNINAKQ